MVLEPISRTPFGLINSEQYAHRSQKERVEFPVRGHNDKEEDPMGLRINTNQTSMTAQRTLAVNNKEQGKTLNKLSSGSRITSSADDAAGLAISEKLRAEIRGLHQAKRNANDGISMIQVAEGGLEEVSNILIRMRELAVQSGTDTLGEQERSFTNKEFQNLKDEVERISSITEFNGIPLLSSESDIYEFQVGINNDPFRDRVSLDTNLLNTTQENLNIGEMSVANKEDAQDSLAYISTAIDNVSGQRAELGAKQNRLHSTVRNLEVGSDNLSIAKSRISDADYAEETANNTRLNILNEASSSVLAQANLQLGRNALKLIG